MSCSDAPSSWDGASTGLAVAAAALAAAATAKPVDAASRWDAASTHGANEQRGCRSIAQ